MSVNINLDMDKAILKKIKKTSKNAIVAQNWSIGPGDEKQTYNLIMWEPTSDKKKATSFSNNMGRIITGFFKKTMKIQSYFKFNNILHFMVIVVGDDEIDQEVCYKCPITTAKVRHIWEPTCPEGLSCKYCEQDYIGPRLCDGGIAKKFKYLTRTIF